MAHHFDTDLARKDPRLNICDFYVFSGRPGFTTMVITTDGDALVSSSDTLHPEGIYAFRFDTDGNGVEDVVFKFRFEAPTHLGADEHRHRQDFTLYHASGSDAGGLGGTVLLHGHTDAIARAGDVQAFVGLAPELWVADAQGFRQVIKALTEEDRFDRAAFVGGRNYFACRNVMVIVLEVPAAMISEGPSRAWSTVSLFGHAPEVQVARFGVPLFTFLLLAGRPDLFDAYHAGVPAGDGDRFGEVIARFAEHLSSRAAGPDGAAAHGAAIARRFCPSMIPYDPRRPGVFSAAEINGRPLRDDAHDAMWTIVAGTPVDDGNSPDVARWRSAFPYYGAPHTAAEQAGLPKLDPESLCLRAL